MLSGGQQKIPVNGKKAAFAQNLYSSSKEKSFQQSSVDKSPFVSGTSFVANSKSIAKSGQHKRSKTSLTNCPSQHAIFQIVHNPASNPKVQVMQQKHIPQRNFTMYQTDASQHLSSTNHFMGDTIRPGTLQDQEEAQVPSDEVPVDTLSITERNQQKVMVQNVRSMKDIKFGANSAQPSQFSSQQHGIGPGTVFKNPDSIEVSITQKPIPGKKTHKTQKSDGEALKRFN